MKTDVETLSPTRAKLTVEVPFAELAPNLAAAYRKIGGSVTIPGFRKGKVPARIIDQRVGRGAVLDEAVNEALPVLYGKALEESGVQALGQPEVDVTGFADGEPLIFTAEVDVRPEVVLPDYQGMEVVVDDVVVNDEDLDSQVQLLRERFGVLKGVERPAQTDDFVSIDLSAAVDGEVLEDGTATGMSYQVGSTALIDGLDEAITGLSAGESTVFPTTLVGTNDGQQAEVTVTVASVKERELPDLDDEFAQTASEFDTLEELRSDLGVRIERAKRLEQGVQARDKALEALLAKVELPLPEGVVKAEIDARRHDLAHQLEQAGLTQEQYLAAEGREADEFDAELESRAADAVKSQFILDAVATAQEIGVTQEELSGHLVRRAQQYGIAPEEFAQQIMQAGQVPALVSEVVRGKALAHVLESVKVVDASGNVVDLEELRPRELDNLPAGADDHAGHDHD